MNLLRKLFKQTNYPLNRHITIRPSNISFFSREICQETRINIQNLLKASPVVLFMKGTPEKPLCGFSNAAIQILNLFSINPAKFLTFNVLEDDRIRQGIKEYSNWPTIPQLYIDNEFIGGSDILLEIYKNGELKKLLNKAGVLLELGKIQII
ncbi:Grx4 family monothiol glutaredoxin [Pneumocystis murina B123]|uniref:Monothiol glutaredoxin-5, mitochondrial n=1 Tax=Pneumocystis murina (strain B123) TaxID=1069680 RepID=M7PF90_PNEMU|nr:Grx4 family monothiol glutaredoxin [Pneumocystis murina B123]EMR09129.1 Grx4 family monothiol glutaredoxin [Pneumocystis murina B123]